MYKKWRFFKIMSKKNIKKYADNNKEIHAEKNTKISEEDENKPQIEVLDEIKPENEIETLKKELDANKNQLLRKIAEFDNYRKRAQKDLAEARFVTKTLVLEDFLTVFDHFQMAMTHSNTSQDLKPLLDGMNMIQSEFSKTFENLGLKKIKSLGEKFNPNLHEAIAREASDEIDEDIIIKEWKSGYMLNDKLVRAATVVVSSGPEA